MRAELLSYLGHVAAWSADYQANPDIVMYVRRDDPELSASRSCGNQSTNRTMSWWDGWGRVAHAGRL
jgi:hypothetical protein